MRKLLVALVLVGGCEVTRVGGAPPIAYAPQTTANPAYANLRAGLVVTPQAREVVQKLTEFLEQVRLYNRISLTGPRCAEYDPQRPIRDPEEMIQASMKKVVRMSHPGEATEPVDVVLVLSVEGSWSIMNNKGQKDGEQITMTLTLDVLSPDRRLLERIQGNGSAIVQEGAWTTTNVGETTAQALAELRAKFGRSAPLAQLAGDIQRREADQQKHDAELQKQADDTPKRHHEKALKAFDVGRFDEAITEWQRAYDLDPRPRVLYNLARCYQQRGEINRSTADLRQARHLYSRFQSNAGPGDPDVTEELKRLDAALADPPPATAAPAQPAP